MDCYCLGLGCCARWTPPQQMQPNKRQLEFATAQQITTIRTHIVHHQMSHTPRGKVLRDNILQFYGDWDKGVEDSFLCALSEVTPKKRRPGSSFTTLDVCLPSKISEACSLAVVWITCWMLQSAENLRRKHKLLGVDVTKIIRVDWQWSQVTSAIYLWFISRSCIKKTNKKSLLMTSSKRDKTKNFGYPSTCTQQNEVFSKTSR